MGVVVGEGGGGGEAEETAGFYYIVNMENSVTGLAGCHYTELVKILSAIQMI